jgi:thymidylate synthase (FAD)
MLEDPANASYCLDDKIGYVSLLQHSGDDRIIVNSARVSFGKQITELEDKDRKLIRFLLDHQHGTPLEHTSLTYLVKCPLFVARQWHRHRVGCCLTADTQVTFVNTNGESSKNLKKKIGELYQLWCYGEPHLMTTPIEKIDEVSTLISTGSSQREACKQVGISRETYRKNRQKPTNGYRDSKQRIKNMKLRVLNEDTLKFEIGHICDVIHQGIQDVFEVELENNKTIKMTANHKVFTNEGWQTLQEAVGLTCNGKTASMSKEAYFMCNGASFVGTGLYQDKVWLQEQRIRGLSLDEMAGDAGCSYHTIRKWLKVHRLQFSQAEMAQALVNKFEGQVWNKGKKGYKVNRVFTDEQKQVIKEARSREKSNFWRGGISTDRANIGRWTREQASKVHQKYSFTCQKCGESSSNLVAHHILPVTQYPEKAKEFTNLITVCNECHKEIHSSVHNEENFAKEVLERDFSFSYDKSRSRQRFYGAHAVKVKSVKYIGLQETYDLSVEGPWHNFVANGIVVHNSINEISGRYVELKDEFYIPPKFRQQSTSNRQASIEATFTQEQQKTSQDLFAEAVESSYQSYQKLLAAGVAREQARGVLPLCTYTQYYWTCNLRSLFHFVKLRDHQDAQWEIQQFAKIMLEQAKEFFPETIKIWEDLGRP